MGRAGMRDDAETVTLEMTPFLADALAGLSGEPRSLPSKYFYDREGSVLFDRICETPEYYPTRCEIEIMRDYGPEMAEPIGPEAMIIELGSGSSLKTPLLLERLERPAAYVPVDIAGEHLRMAAESLARRFPSLPILPVNADFTGEFPLPDPAVTPRRRVIYFPGSTIGNFPPPEATTLLRRLARMTGAGGGLLIGVDLKKDVRTLEAAYNDAAGVTRAFNLNLLERLRRELHAEVSVHRFEHRAVYNESEGRIEMHLVSRAAQSIRLGGREFTFRAGETIHTENSYKYDPAGFAALAREAGWRKEGFWTDTRGLFSVQLFTAQEPGA
ncbi:MAG TPA: L-histidine N(alpha)-methyltransferase [Bacteroidetes bacterium]|nr:L-histidine N(alpha)-methyltransferase [Bacteroidota bacterium]